MNRVPRIPPVSQWARHDDTIRDGLLVTTVDEVDGVERGQRRIRSGERTRDGKEIGLDLRGHPEGGVCGRPLRLVPCQIVPMASLY